MRYGVFLRAVNVGGNGKLPMEELRRICMECGFEDVKTYIASGNVALTSALSPSGITARLDQALHAYAGKPVGVFVRSPPELEQIVAANPFPEAKGNKVTAILLNTDPNEALTEGIKGQADEEIVAGQGGLYVHYPSGMGRSKLKIIGAEHGTARNMNTLVKMGVLVSIG